VLASILKSKMMDTGKLLVDLAPWFTIVAVAAIIAMAFMHAYYIKSCGREAGLQVGRFYNATGLKLVTVVFLVIGLIVVALIGKVSGDAIVGVFGTLGGYVLGDLIQTNREAKRAPKPEAADSNGAAE
jgi:hypothetical protein